MSKFATALLGSTLLCTTSYVAYGQDIDLSTLESLIDSPPITQEVESMPTEEEITSIDGFIKAATDGNVDAMYNLGTLYADGDEDFGVEQDYNEAAKWYKMAAESGDTDAQLNLGILYGDGLGVTQSYKEAFKWYLKSAESGNEIAQYNLGVIYSQGKGVEVNYPEAVKWYTKAAESGDPTAKYNLAIIYFQGMPGVEKNLEESFKWTSSAVLDGDEDAYTMLSLPAFEALTAEWYRKRAEQGNLDAQIKIASRYLWGKGIEKDIVKAHMWFNIASSSGDENALASRESVEASMTLEQIDEAQKLAREWRAANGE